MAENGNKSSGAGPGQAKDSLANLKKPGGALEGVGSAQRQGVNKKDAVGEHGAEIFTRQGCRVPPQGLSDLAGSVSGIDYYIAKCVERQGERRKQEFSLKDSNYPNTTKNLFTAVTSPKIALKKGTPCVSYQKKRAGIGLGGPSSVNLILLHEPMTWTVKKTMESLTAACLGVHYTVDRDGTIEYHAYDDDLLDHCPGRNESSIAVEVQNRFSTYNQGNKWIPPDKWENIHDPAYGAGYVLASEEEKKDYAGLKTIPSTGTTEWETNDLRTPKKWTGGKKNWILPPENQMIQLYNFVIALMEHYSIPPRFPGVLLSEQITGDKSDYGRKPGFYWGSFKVATAKKYLGVYDTSVGMADPGTIPGDFTTSNGGGLTSHAHSGTSTHTDGLFYEHYLYMRIMYSVSHREAFDTTIRAAESVCVRNKSGLHTKRPVLSNLVTFLHQYHTPAGGI